jgi:hypothetical protein
VVALKGRNSKAQGSIAGQTKSKQTLFRNPCGISLPCRWDGGAPDCAGREELLIYVELILAILGNLHYKSCQDCLQIYLFPSDTSHGRWMKGLGALITIQGTI